MDISFGTNNMDINDTGTQDIEEEAKKCLPLKSPVSTKILLTLLQKLPGKLSCLSVILLTLSWSWTIRNINQHSIDVPSSFSSLEWGQKHAIYGTMVCSPQTFPGKIYIMLGVSKVAQNDQSSEDFVSGFVKRTFSRCRWILSGRHITIVYRFMRSSKLTILTRTTVLVKPELRVKHKSFAYPLSARREILLWAGIIGHFPRRKRYSLENSIFLLLHSVHICGKLWWVS